MKIAAAILTGTLAALLAGCVVSGKPKTVAAAPAAPKPTVAPAPPPPPPPLSTPQTQVELPPPQPISQEAVLTTQTPEEPTPTPAPPKPANRTRTSSAAPHNAPEPAAPAPAAGPPAESNERPPVGELVSEEEKRQLLADTQRSRQDAQHSLSRAGARRLNRQQQQLKASAEQFLQLSLEAEKRGDVRQARELAGRAAVLAKDLQP